MNWIKRWVCLLLVSAPMGYAADKIEPLEMASPHMNWVFSGVVSSETGHAYGYFFQIQRDGVRFHLQTALFDAETKQVLLSDEGESVIDSTSQTHWQVGHSFLRFNPINDSWIFGLKTEDKRGFNFKVDMLGQVEKASDIEVLRPGLDLVVMQTGPLNGHIRLGGETREQFVTARSAWFRKTWLTDEDRKPNLLSGVLCRFTDGSGFYSMRLRESDALQGALAVSCDAQGHRLEMSQFIDFKEELDGAWHIRVPSPSDDLVLSDVMKNHSVIAGFISKGSREGFCMMSDDVLLAHADEPRSSA